MTHQSRRHTSTSRAEHGMATAEYAVGTIGACTLALVLHEVATDGTWLDLLTEMFRRALSWHRLLDGFPVPNLRTR